MEIVMAFALGAVIGRAWLPMRRWFAWKLHRRRR